MKNEPLCHAPCPIARSLGRIGDSWSIMILRDAFAGFTRFDEFQKSSNVAPNILSRRLKASRSAAHANSWRRRGSDSATPSGL